MKKEVKIIFHIDLNAFFATCAIIKEPYLANKIFVVGGNSTMKRGVISTASYKARALGIRSGMSIHEAMNIYPKLLVVPIDFKLYIEQSNKFFNFLKRYSPLILKGSIDEAYMDITELAKKRHPLEVAKEIQDTLNNEYKLPVSIGIAPTLFLAKMASDLKKPLGITVIRKSDIVKKILPLSINDMFGIGKKTAPLLKEEGIFKIGDFLRKENEEKILKHMKKEQYLKFVDHILGRSSDIVDPKKYAIPQSISNETTLLRPIDQVEELLIHLKEMFDEAYHRLMEEELIAKGVFIKFKDKDFNVTTRSYSFNDYTNDQQVLYEEIEKLFDDHYQNIPIRLIGCGFHNIILKSDLREEFNLFTYEKITKREDRIYKVIRQIEERYPNSIKKGIKNKL